MGDKKRLNLVLPAYIMAEVDRIIKVKPTIPSRTTAIIVALTEWIAREHRNELDRKG